MNQKQKTSEGPMKIVQIKEKKRAWMKTSSGIEKRREMHTYSYEKEMIKPD